MNALTPSHRPARASGFFALFAAVTVVFVSLTGAVVALVVASGGVFALTAGIVRGGRGWLAVGAMGLFGGVVIAGLAGAGTLLVLGGAGATILAWDLGEHAIGLGEQIGREATTTRQELVHAGSSVGVGAVGIGLALAVAGFGAGPIPVAAFVVGLVASIVFVAALRT